MDQPTNRSKIPEEISRRRTFAIIYNPDAGKTTLTEKFLLFGGAIQMAGQVRAKGEARRTRSDFMQMEKDRGISVSASAMSFDFKNFRFKNICFIDFLNSCISVIKRILPRRNHFCYSGLAGC